MRQKHFYLPVRRALMGTVAIVMLLFLAACGTQLGAKGSLNSPNANGTGVATGTVTTNGNSTTTATTTPPRTSTAQNCGAVHTMRLLIVPADIDHVKDVENCFWQAFQQCHPATMIFAQNDLDTGTINTFSLQSVNGSCVISDGVQSFVAPRPPSTAKNYTCAGLTRESDGLHFHSCEAAGTIIVPIANAV